MNARDRVITALEHREPDRVPFDLGASLITGIHKTAYNNFINYMNVPEKEIEMFDVVQQISTPSEKFLLKIGVDTRNVSPLPSSQWHLKYSEDAEYRYFTDEWGIVWRMPLDNGFYFDMYKNPMAEIDTLEGLANYQFPNPTDDARFVGLRQRALIEYGKGNALVMSSMSAGILELGAWLRGFQNFFMDLALRPEFAHALLNKVYEIKQQYWERILNEVGDLIQVVQEADDLGSQNSLLISPKMYRKFIKPLHKKLFDFIHSKTKAKVFIHSCGAVADLIPDLIDSGVDILNPVQLSARNMDPVKLKQEFGKDIVFWGGGIDTQSILPKGNPTQVREAVKRQIEILAPGGGFVFNTVHNIQPDVPPENLMAMIEALHEFGKY